MPTEEKKQRLMRLARVADEGDMALFEEIIKLEEAIKAIIIRHGKDGEDGEQGGKGDIGDKGQDGIDGKNPSKFELIELIRPLIKDIRDKVLSERRDKLENIRQEMNLSVESVSNRIDEVKGKIPEIPKSETPEQHRNNLESFKGNERLSIDAINNLRERLEELEKKIPIGKLGSAGSGFSKKAMDFHIIDDETPSGAINGSNTVFTLANIPNPARSLKVYVNGQRVRLTEDYTFSVGTITFNTAPPTTSVILCDYRIK